MYKYYRAHCYNNLIYRVNQETKKVEFNVKEPFWIESLFFNEERPLTGVEEISEKEALYPNYQSCEL